MSVRQGHKPGEVIVEAKTQRSSKDWIRTLIVGADGGLVFAMLKQPITAEFNDRMAIYVADFHSLDPLWEKEATIRRGSCGRDARTHQGESAGPRARPGAVRGHQSGETGAACAAYWPRSPRSRDLCTWVISISGWKRTHESAETDDQVSAFTLILPGGRRMTGIGASSCSRCCVRSIRSPWPIWPQMRRSTGSIRRRPRYGRWTASGHATDAITARCSRTSWTNTRPSSKRCFGCCWSMATSR